MENTYTLYGDVVTGDCIIKNGAVAVQDGRILSVGPQEAVPQIGAVQNWSESYLLPGFIDIHCHAGGDLSLIHI